MKVRIDADEWYPVYSVSDDKYGLEVDADPEAVARWEEAADVFESAQREMADLYESACEVEQKRAAEEKAAKEAAAREERERAEAERRKAAAERKAKRDAMWRAIEASGGVVYDAHGQPVAKVHGSPTGVRLEP